MHPLGMTSWRCGLACLALGAVLLFALPAEADTLSPEIDVGAVPSVGGASGASVAFDGAQYLVAWPDYRFEGAVLGTRVSATGSSLDPFGIEIHGQTTDTRTVRVAYHAGAYWVVWDDDSKLVKLDREVLLQRCGPDGLPLDEPLVRVTSVGDGPAIGCASTGCLIAWFRDSAVYAARLDSHATVLDPTGIPVALAASYKSNLALAATDSGYLLAWNDCKPGPSLCTPYVSRVGFDGTVYDPDGFRLITAVDEAADGLAVASNGSISLVAWVKEVSYDERVVRVARFQASGAVLDPSGISLSAVSESPYDLRAAVNGGAFGVVWTDHVEDVAKGVRVSPDGALLDSAPVVFTGMTRVEDITTGPQSALVAGIGDAPQGRHIGVMRWSETGAVLDDSVSVLSSEAVEATDPAVSFDGTNFLLSWEVDGMRAVRVTPQGQVLGPSVVVSSEHMGVPDMAFDGANHVIVFDEGDGSYVVSQYVVRVGTDGVPIGSPVVVFGGEEWQPYWCMHQMYASQSHPRVASNGNGSAMVWAATVWCSTSDGEILDYYENIYALRMTADGQVLDSPPIVLSAAHDMAGPEPVIAAGSDGYLVLWKGGGAFLQGDQHVPVTSVDAIDVAAGPGGYFALFREAGALHGQFLDSSGMPAGNGVLIASPSYYPTWNLEARVRWDGDAYVAVWTSPDTGNGVDLMARRIGLDGTLGDQVPVSALPLDELSPTVAGGSGGVSLLAYARWDKSAPYANLQVRARVMTKGPGPLGNVCGSDGGCASGVLRGRRMLRFDVWRRNRGRLPGLQRDGGGIGRRAVRVRELCEGVPVAARHVRRGGALHRGVAGLPRGPAQGGPGELQF